MSLLSKIFLVCALFAQVCSAASVHNHIARHSALLNQQLGSWINPSGIVPTVPAPHPEDVNGTGWVYLTNSFNSDCSAPFLSYGVPVGQCIVEANYAYKFNVVQDSCDGGVISYYSDVDCTVRTGNTDLETFTNNCTRATDNQKLTDGSTPIYALFSCTNSTDVPRTSDAGALVTMTYEETETCDPKAAHEFIAFNNDVCITIDNTTFTSSCDHGQPIYNLAGENVPNCAGILEPIPLPTTCDIDPVVGDADDDGLYVPPFLQPPPSTSTTPFPTAVYVPMNGSQVFSCQESLIPSAEPTTAPTILPSNEPTAAPTNPTAPPSLQPSASPSVTATSAPTIKRTSYPTAAAPVAATFSASQVFNGISYTTYSSNVALYSSTLIQTIAASMIDVPTSAITGFTATSTTPQPHAHTSFFSFRVGKNNVRREGQASLSVRRLQGDAISSTYTVTLQSLYTAEQLAAQLENSITSGAFDNTLHSLAVTNSATALTTVSSGEVTVTYPPSDNGNNNSDKLSDGAIAGIVIGCVVGALIIGFLVYYFMCSSKHSLLGSQPHLEL